MSNRHISDYTDAAIDYAFVAALLMVMGVTLGFAIGAFLLT